MTLTVIPGRGGASERYHTGISMDSGSWSLRTIPE